LVIYHWLIITFFIGFRLLSLLSSLSLLHYYHWSITLVMVAGLVTSLVGCWLLVITVIIGHWPLSLSLSLRHCHYHVITSLLSLSLLLFHHLPSHCWLSLAFHFHHIIFIIIIITIGHVILLISYQYCHYIVIVISSLSLLSFVTSLSFHWLHRSFSLSFRHAINIIVCHFQYHHYAINNSSLSSSFLSGHH